MIQYTCVFRSNRIQVLERDGFECRICSSRDKLEVHHVIPLRVGGSDELGNLITYCSKCHGTVDARLRPKMSGELMKLLCPKCNKIYFVASVRPCECMK